MLVYRVHARYCEKAVALGKFHKRWVWDQECLIRQVS